MRFGPLVVIVLMLAACSKSPVAEIDPQISQLGTAEVTAQLVEILGAFPPNDLYNYVYILKYKVLKTHRGNVNGPEILVGQYNPLKPREQAQDDVSGKVGGHLKSFKAGDLHHMALEAPLDNFWLGGIIDKYFESKGTRYWAVWTNPGAN